MKIAISGASSVGKSTISKYFSEYLQVQYINEFGYIQDDMKTLNLHDISIQEQINLQNEIIYRKIKNENENDSFISDRSVVDSFVFWINRCMPYTSENDTTSLYNAVKQHLNQYDKIFLLEFDPLYFVWESKRQKNKFRHYKFEWLLKSLYAHFEKEIIILKPDSIENKINSIKTFLAC